MSNIVVSTAVLDFMQAANQGAAQASLALDPTSAPTFAGCTLTGSIALPDPPYGVVLGSWVLLAGAYSPLSNNCLECLNLEADDFRDILAKNCIGLSGLSVGGGSNAQITPDGNGNVQIQGYDGSTAADIIGFSASGVASVTAASDSTQLPIARTVGGGYAGIAGSINPGSEYIAEVTVTGCLAGDAVSIDVPYGFNGWGSTGGLMVAGVSISGGVVSVTFGNVDLNNSYALGGDVYVRVIR